MFKRVSLGPIAVAAAIGGAAVLVEIDRRIAWLDLGPILVLPIIVVAMSGAIWLCIGLAVALAACATMFAPGAAAAAPAIHVANGAILAVAYLSVVAIIQVWMRQQSRLAELSAGVSTAMQSALRAFNAEEPPGLGWSFNVVRGALEGPATCVHDVRRRGDGYDLLVTDVAGGGVAGVMILATVRSLFPVTADLDPRARLTTQNEHLRPVCEAATDCRVWDARLSSVGAVRFASAGFAPAVVARRDGAMERIGGGGLPLGRFLEPYLVEGMTILDEGDALIVLDDRMREIATEDGSVLQRLAARHPGLRDELMRAHGPEIGLAIVAHRVRTEQVGRGRA